MIILLQLSTTKSLGEAFTHPPGERDVGERRILLGVSRKDRCIADEQIRNIVTLADRVDNRGL